jgi:hypothetical protein
MSDSFFQKPMGVASLIGSAIVGPYFYFGGTEAPSKSTPPSVQSPGDPTAYLTGQLGQLPGVGLPSPAYSATSQPFPSTSLAPSLTNAPVSDFREVLRFDITPAWVPQHFNRVTTVLADTRLDGLRVPFVSGTQPTDIAGSLTYFFDAQQALRRIQLVGTCGDPSILVNLMLQYYHLHAEPSLGGHLYTTRWNNRVTSVMQLTPAPVIYSHDAHSRYQIFLELNQPTVDYALTAEAEQILRNANLTQRW